jgi:hypothetical protein
MHWLTAHPPCRVVRPSMAEARPLALCAKTTDFFNNLLSSRSKQWQ